ncbi:hypothetical protein NCAS_0C02130 [Naumovozyma castellii]|uniref:VPS9 domain-containing protein n=1 Tax=Naumovozyma castellii TaxID=27288 RepID=G0VCJ3_NAUCA|nr:hypothetical protein NCAS_0C02130 [Naumovozyma castellii CBS 4309]CCC69203.1 hypothetical protein NCAS_0C02130 [Naumovozyma castellii CBS 4309]
MRQLYTPPISNPKFDTSQSIKESYKSSSSLSSLSSSLKREIHIDETETTGEEDVEDSSSKESQNSSSQVSTPDKFEKLLNRKDGTTVLTQEEITNEVTNITELPLELSRLISFFIDDLKQPKYVKPLSIIQLASVFQSFYIKFDKSSFQYLTTINNSNNNSANNVNMNTFFSAKETLSSGLSGIFSRSRSNSGNSVTIASRRPRRSSSLFSTDSVSNLNPSFNHQLLSEEEINRQLKINELNNLKIEKFMILCERDIFKKILQVGTSVPSPIKNNNNDNDKPIINSINGQIFKVSNLFKNSPEFIEYDKKLNEKINFLNDLSTGGRINLIEFLDINEDTINENKDESNTIEKLFDQFLLYSISPFEKIDILLKIHKSMAFYSKEMSNDEFLSLLIFYIIKFSLKRTFLNAEFVKLFRYKKKLVENELFVLTNVEAALMFVEGLTFNDFSDKLINKLKPEERKLLECPISEKITLPKIPSDCDKTINDGTYMATTLGSPRSEVLRSNSYDRFRTIIDSSLKNVIGKIKYYTPPVPIVVDEVDEDGETTLEPDPLLNNENMEGLKEVKSITVSHSTTSLHSKISSSSELPTIPDVPDIPDDWKAYKDMNFDDLKMSDLKKIFDIYQRLID